MRPSFPKGLVVSNPPLSARLLHFLALSVVVKPTKRGSVSLYNFLMHRGISGNLNHLRCA
jgi:hypothetical protein